MAGISQLQMFCVEEQEQLTNVRLLDAKRSVLMKLHVDEVQT